MLKKPRTHDENIAVLYFSESKTNSKGHCGSKTNTNNKCGDKSNSGLSCGDKANSAPLRC